MVGRRLSSKNKVEKPNDWPIDGALSVKVTTDCTAVETGIVIHANAPGRGMMEKGACQRNLTVR